jgi:hypothetical protein
MNQYNDLSLHQCLNFERHSVILQYTSTITFWQISVQVSVGVKFNLESTVNIKLPNMPSYEQI